jgi:hypothetical protein
MLDWIADTLFNRSQRRLYQELEERKPLFWNTLRMYQMVSFRLGTVQFPRSTPTRWKACVLVIDANGFVVYPQSQKMDERLTFKREDLRWFGRPNKYQQGLNEMWLHFELKDRWHLLQLRTNYYQMQRLVRVMKKVATPEQVKAYRRRRPYIHYGPVEAYPAEQDIYGVWTVQPLPEHLYLMPYALIILNMATIQRVIALEKIQQIEALRRMDAPTSDGVVRFKADGETFAYTLADFATFGASLAEGAKRTLEDPVIVKKKKDDEDWEEDEFMS